MRPALHLVWLVPFTALLMLGGFMIGFLGWCGDDADGCRFGLGPALGQLLPGLATVVVVAFAVLGLFTAVPWREPLTARRRVGLIVAIDYLALVILYLVVTAIV
jgi:hypothetical protein